MTSGYKRALDLLHVDIFVPRLGVGTDVSDRPAIESARLDLGGVVGREIVAELVALVHR
jgi:hypothetical protein